METWRAISLCQWPTTRGERTSTADSTKLLDNMQKPNASVVHVANLQPDFYTFQTKGGVELVTSRRGKPPLYPNHHSAVAATATVCSWDQPTNQPTTSD